MEISCTLEKNLPWHGFVQKQTSWSFCFLAMKGRWPDKIGTSKNAEKLDVTDVKILWFSTIFADFWHYLQNGWLLTHVSNDMNWISSTYNGGLKRLTFDKNQGKKRFFEKKMSKYFNFCPFLVGVFSWTKSMSEVLWKPIGAQMSYNC